MIDELIEDIVVSEDSNIKVIFKCEDKYFEALDFLYIFVSLQSVHHLW